MNDFLGEIERLRSRGDAVATATVVATRGSAPRPVGSKLVVEPMSGEFTGSVSGGCVESDVCQHAISVVEAGKPMLLSYGIAEDFALGIGLPCGGEIDVFVEPVTPFHERLRAVLEAGDSCVVFTVLDGPRLGDKLLVTEAGETAGEDRYELAGRVPEMLQKARHASIAVQGTRILAEVFGPPPRLAIYGAVDVAEALAQVGRQLGWHTIVADARQSYVTEARIPSAHELIAGWPQAAFEQIAPDASTAIVILTHDEKFDEPALRAALASEAFYIGALGSRRTQEARRERLLAAGFDDGDLGRISGPCGLDIGGETPQETAISIMGEILAVRAGKHGGRLQESKGRIHPIVV